MSLHHVKVFTCPLHDTQQPGVVIPQDLALYGSCYVARLPSSGLWYRRRRELGVMTSCLLLHSARLGGRTKRGTLLKMAFLSISLHLLICWKETSLLA